MKSWKKKKGLMRGARFVTVLEPMERQVLGELCAKVSESIMARAQSAPKDELSELTGIASGHKEAPTDPALARLLPDFERAGDEEFEGDNSMLRSLHEHDICRAKLENLQVIAQAVGPDGSEEISLSEQEVHPFLAGLNDLRLYLAATEPKVQGDEDVLEWLAFNQDSLLHALMGN